MPGLATLDSMTPQAAMPRSSLSGATTDSAGEAESAGEASPLSGGGDSRMSVLQAREAAGAGTQGAREATPSSIQEAREAAACSMRGCLARVRRAYERVAACIEVYVSAAYALRAFIAAPRTL
jgi:hypothetical protein